MLYEMSIFQFILHFFWYFAGYLFKLTVVSAKLTEKQSNYVVSCSTLTSTPIKRSKTEMKCTICSIYMAT